MLDNHDYIIKKGPENYESYSNEENKKLDEIREFVIGIQECVYKTGDIEILEHCLEELCSLLEIKDDETDVKIEKKNSKRMLHWYLGYQRAYLNMLNGETENV